LRSERCVTLWSIKQSKELRWFCVTYFKLLFRSSVLALFAGSCCSSFLCLLRRLRFCLCTELHREDQECGDAYDHRYPADARLDKAEVPEHVRRLLPFLTVLRSRTKPADYSNRLWTRLLGHYHVF